MPQNVTDWPTFWVQVVYTLVTVGILVAAIWGQPIRTRFFGPRLKVSLANASGSLTNRGDGSPTRYFHLRIDNERPSMPARSVKVLCTHLGKATGSTPPVLVPLPIPLQFLWSFPQFHALTQTIVSDHRCDLGHIDQGSTGFEFDFYIKPNNVDTAVKAGETALLEIKVEGENCPSATAIRLRVTWDGEWAEDDEAMASHLVVTPL